MADPPKEIDSDASSEPTPATGPTEEDLAYEREERLGIQGVFDEPVDLTFPPPDEENLAEPNDANR